MTAILVPRRRVTGVVLTSTVAFALGLTLAAAHAPGNMASCADQVYDRLFFGLGTSDGIVSDAAWTQFLSEIVTPRFPNGLTVVDANGQWRAVGQQDLTVERSRVVEIAHDDSPETDRHIGEVVAIYKHRHRQRSVMLTRARVEVCF